ncbi:MAG TPA: HAD-IC family P-type ATPase [Polyangiaceae bacterium]|nr:HAD-IC family P-type ATPase [Polyangiaceae bacterium]
MALPLTSEAAANAPARLDFPYWSLGQDEVLSSLGTTRAGLSSLEASERLERFGPNSLREQHLSWLTAFAGQVKSPLVLLLVFAAAASALTGEWIDASIVLLIVACSVAVGFSREYSAQRAAAALKARIQTRARALRDGREVLVPVDELVPGDVVRFSAGSIVPADGVLLTATDCHVSQAALTGESYPVLKNVEPSAVRAPLAARHNCAFMGTNVRSGTAECVVVHTGSATHFGAIAARLTLRPPLSEYDRGMLRFGYMLTSAMVVMTIAVFVVHVARGRPAIETLLFAIALAVGLSPELLPAILSVNLGRSAKQMAKQGVLVRHLNAIENLGSMDVLCTDKTGTLTEGVVQLEGAYTARICSWRWIRTNLFVEVDPNQKERIILALKKMGHVVGFLGDGVNDALAMHAADTSLSVDQAVDVAREAADFVLLERHLDVVRRGIEAGRRTFANTLKYVLMTMSANLGNMISMAIASLWLPFLPLLAGQIHDERDESSRVIGQVPDATGLLAPALRLQTQATAHSVVEKNAPLPAWVPWRLVQRQHQSPYPGRHGRRAFEP